MAVKMRLMRMGKKKQPMYRVVVIDGRSPRDGRYIEQIGRYAPLEDPSLVEIDNEKATEWLAKGAQPTEAVEKLLNISGAMNTMKVRTGQIHTVGAPAPAEKAPATVVEAASVVVEEIVEAVAEEPVVSEVVAEDSSEAPADGAVEVADEVVEAVADEAVDTAADAASEEE